MTDLWVPWFAWYPVFIPKSGWTWLTTVRRRTTMFAAPGCVLYWGNDYRTLEASGQKGDDSSAAEAAPNPSNRQE